MYRYIFFDLDGTLTDPGEGITKSVAYALEKFGIHVEDRSSLYKFIGPPLKDSFMAYYGFSEEDAEKAVEYYREYFGDVGLFENRPYDGIYDVLETLKNRGYILAVATSKPEVYTERILDKFSLDRYFDYVAGATLDSSRVKKSDVIAHAAGLAGITDMKQILMVGDRKHDVEGAKAHGIDCAGVVYGYGSRQELSDAGAEYILEKPDDIFDIV